MRIDDSSQQRFWAEPELAEPQSPAPQAQPEASPGAPAATPFWAGGAPLQQSLLNQLPPAAIQAPAAAAPAPAPAPTPGGSYVGEPAVSAPWLATRETALVGVRRDYEGARAAAQSQVGCPGWAPAAMVTDESGHLVNANGLPAVFVADPNAPPVQTGWDESGPTYQPAGQWLAFDEAAFAAHYRAEGGAALQNLAASYGTDAGTLLARHPEMWTLATSDHALNAGPPPSGRAMGDATQLGTLDLYLADPQVADLISRYGGNAAPATGGLALEQVRVYGPARYEQLTKLSNAMQSVRQQYSDAMAQAERNGGPGWVERPRSITTTDESGALTTQPLYVTDESGQRLLGADGQPQVLTERVFDPDAFTGWYLQQGGAQHQAFASFYGRSHTQYATDESGRSFASNISFDNPNWQMGGSGGAMSHRELVSLDLNHAPRLNDSSAVGFDLEAGWATHHSNIHQKRDWFETVVQVAAVAVVSYFTAGAASGWAAAAGWGTTATAVAAGAAAGAAGSFVSGAMNGNLAFKDILRGALAGGLSGGLVAEFGATAASYGPAGTVALRTTVQGGIQALLGGSFKDGALAGFASGLADVTSSGLNANIDKALASGAMDATQAIAARSFARVLGSAIRVAASPDNPGAAFASAFLSDVLGAMDPAGFHTPATPTPATGTVFDDDGNLMPGVTNAAAPWDQQMANIRAGLERQGMDGATAAQVAGDYEQRVQEQAFNAFVAAQPAPVLVAGNGWTPDVRSARDVINEVESRIADGSLQGRQVGYAIEDTYQAYLKLGAGAASRDTPPTVDEERAASRLISLIGDLGQVAQDQGLVLSAEQQALVLQSRALQVQGNLPEIYGASVTGGILGLRQSQRQQALQAWANKPSLRHPDQVVGRTDGGPGQWVYAPRRSGGQDYQEQVSGVPRGIEYQVRDVNFDGFDATRRVAVDSKDWQGYPPPGTDFWQRSVVREATGQLAALDGTGVKLEWHVSTPQAAEQLRAAFRDAAIRVPALRDVNIVVVPRVGP